jgi:hypothetical protein
MCLALDDNGDFVFTETVMVAARTIGMIKRVMEAAGFGS